MNFTIDELLHLRQIEQRKLNSQKDEEENLISSSVSSARLEKERARDQKYINIFETQLENPYPANPFIFIFDKFDARPDGSIPSFPRLTKSIYDILKIYPSRTTFSDSLVYTLLQEMIIHPSVANELGSILIRYCKNMPNYQLNLQIWLNFISEISITYPNILVYALAIVRPNCFQQEFTDNYSNNEVIILLLASLLCKCVIESDKVMYIQSSLNLYLENPISPKVFEIFCSSLDHIDPKNLISFPSFLPHNKNTSQIMNFMCFTIICKYLGIDETHDIHVIIDNLDKLQILCDPENPELELFAHIVLIYLEKLCFIIFRMSEATADDFQRIISALILKKNYKIDQLISLKEKMQFLRVQIGFLIEKINERI